MVYALLTVCLMQNAYLCRSFEIGVARGDPTIMSCAMNGMIYVMALDQQNVTFIDHETGLTWMPRGVRCEERELGIEGMAKAAE